MKIEQIVDGGIASQKALSMRYGLKLSHASLSHSSWLMR